MRLLKQRVLLTFLSMILVFGLYAQTGTVIGKITDAKTGEVLPGANIVVDGTTKGVSSKVDGTYVLENVSAGQVTIIASFLGYKSLKKTISVKNGQSTTADFSLAQDMMMLEEMIVVGYGTEKKKDVTGSIEKIGAEVLQNVPVPSFDGALQGKAAGVQVTQDNGMAGGTVTIRVRGTSSLKASSEPLYVVDGVPIISGSYTSKEGMPDQTNVLSQINPNDIESIEILKDAAAAAIYGARGANGVVLITTKKGSGTGTSQINFNYYTGASSPTNILKVLDGPQYLEITKEAWLNSNLDKVYGGDTAKAIKAYYEQLPAGIYNPKLTYEQNRAIIDNTNIDWIDQTLRTGSFNSMSLTASGGTNKMNYYLGGSYDDIKGILIGDDFKRYNGRINLNYTGYGRLSFGGNLGFMRTIRHRVPTGWAGGLGTAQSRSLPIMPIYDADSNYFSTRYSLIPISQNKTNVIAERENLIYEATAASVLGNVFGVVEILPYLSFRSDFGFNTLYQREYRYEGTIFSDEASAKDRRVTVESYSFMNSFIFDKKIGENHKVGALVGMNAEQTNQYDVEFWGNDFPSPELKNPNNALKQGGSSYEGGFGFLSYIGRATYGFKGKYLLSASIRRDGSSRFGPDRRFGWFPAASLGWIISDENFWQKVPYFNFFKLRASYGIVGNAAIGNYDYLGTFYTTKYNDNAGIGINRIANPDLHWEKTTQYNGGIEFGLFEGRISGSFDYYYKRTSDLLLDVNVPQTSGSSAITKNIGELENKGFDMSVRSYNLTGKLKWITDINLGRNQNKILDIQGQIVSGKDLGGNYGNNFAQEGYPIGAWRLVEYAGVDPETGEPLFINQLTGKATTEYNYERDAVVVGNPYPALIGGISNSFSYKNFDLNFLFSFALDYDVYRDDGKFLEAGKVGSNWNQMATVLDRWQKPGDVTNIPKLFWEDKYSTYNTTQFLNDASLGRLKNISLSYKLPQTLTDKIKVKGAKVYIMGTNLLTFTKFPGWDPEVNRDLDSGNNNVTQSVTYLSPPQAKTITAGINIDL